MGQQNVEWIPVCSCNYMGTMGNSFALQFKGNVDTMSHSLRIKEDSYNNMFVDKEKALAEAKVILERAQKLKNEAKVIKAKEATYVETIHKLEIDVNFLK